MSKEMTVLVAGLWIIVVPQLGIPGSWRTALLTLTGVGLVVLGLYLRAEAVGLGLGESQGARRTFIENTPPEPHDRDEALHSLN